MGWAYPPALVLARPRRLGEGGGPSAGPLEAVADVTGDHVTDSGLPQLGAETSDVVDADVAGLGGSYVGVLSARAVGAKGGDVGVIGPCITEASRKLR